MGRRVPRSRVPGTLPSQPPKRGQRRVSPPSLPGPAPRAPRHGREPLPRAYRAALAAIGFGIAVSLAALGVGLVLLARQETPAAQRLQAVDRPEDGTRSVPTRIELGARHLGGLELDVQALVTVDGRELTRAEVVGFADMVQMPLAHRLQPFPLREEPGRPGLYSARTAVPMVGDWEVRVEVRRPVRAEERKVIAVATVQP